MQAALENLKRIRSEIRNVSRRKRRLEKCSHPEPLRRRVLLVYIYSGYCSQVAADFLLKCQCHGLLNAESDAVADVETLYIQAPLDELVALETDPLSQCSAADVHVAMEYVVQHRLRSWVEHLNCDKGVAPSRAMLTAHAGQCIPDIVPAEIRQRLERQLHGPARGQRKWLSRFRRRWKCRVGALPVADDDPADLEQKALRVKANKRMYALLSWIFVWFPSSVLRYPTPYKPGGRKIDQSVYDCRACNVADKKATKDFVCAGCEDPAREFWVLYFLLFLVCFSGAVSGPVFLAPVPGVLLKNKEKQNFGTNFWGPFLAPHFCVFFGARFVSPFAQALAYWQWLGFARLEAVTAGQEPLIVNVDETSISFVTGLKGTVIKACKGKRAREAASLSQRRSNFTYLAAITPDPAIQPFLPQFVLLNEHQISKEELAAAVRSAPPNVRMLRRPSAWCDNAVMRQYLSALRASLQTAAPDRYAILLLDVARAHVHNSIRDHAKRCRVRLVYVPAGTTKYLQPCDLQLFHSFKRVLEEVWRERKGHAVIGALTMQFRLGVLFEAMKRVLATRKWEKAFQLAGVLGDQRSIKRSLLDVLGWTQVPEIPVRPPSLADAARIFPRRMKIDTMSYIYWHKDRPLPDEARRNLPCLD